MSDKMGGIKFDGLKPIMSLLPSEALWEVARVLTYGYKKYTVCIKCGEGWQDESQPCSKCGGETLSGANNWRKGMRWSRVISALERHLADFKQGVDLDQDSNLLHISQIAVNALFLLTYQLFGLGDDDRSIVTEEQQKHRDKIIEILENPLPNESLNLQERLKNND